MIPPRDNIFICKGSFQLKRHVAFFVRRHRTKNWTYIRRSKDALDVILKSYVRSLYVLCPGGFWYDLYLRADIAILLFHRVEDNVFSDWILQKLSFDDSVGVKMHARPMPWAKVVDMEMIIKWKIKWKLNLEISHEIDSYQKKFDLLESCCFCDCCLLHSCCFCDCCWFEHKKNLKGYETWPFQIFFDPKRTNNKNIKSSKLAPQ